MLATLIWLLAAAGGHAQSDGIQADAGQAEAGVTTSYGISPFGTLKYPADFKHLDYVNPDAPKGGEISEWMIGGFDSMNPYTIKGRAGALSSMFYESLLTGVDDEPGAAYCLICKTITYPKDRSWVIFTMRPEAKFSDGSPVTAEDVAFSYETLLKKGLPDFRFVLAQQVDKAEVLGPHKIKFTFKKGFPTRDLPQMVGSLPIFSKADFERTHRDFAASSLKPMLGSGPYVLDSLDVDQRIVYRRNPDYWGKDLPINVGRYNFDKIRIEYYGDSNAAFEGFKAGSYTFRGENSSKLWATSYNFPAVQKGWVKVAELPNGNIASGQGFIFNLRRPKFQDIRVREAIGLAFNFEWSNETLFYGQYARINSFWENSDLAAKGKPSPGELKLLEPLAGELPPGVLTEDAVMAPVSGKRQLDRRNLRKASRLLDEAGWKVGKDGKRRNAKGETLKVEFLNDQQAFDRVINPYVENLQRLGIDAYMTRVDSSQYTTRIRNPDYDFDIITGMLGQSYIPSSGLKQYFGSETANVSTFNQMGLQDKAVDALIDDVLNANTKPAMVTAVHALDRVLRALHFWVPEWYKNKYTVAYYDMYEHPKNMPPHALGETDFWWYNAKKAAALKAAGAFQ
ncbi:extracellular solute-binding protein [Acidimangrovimonas pyrenivorans]|uniref:Extracellular solute-binding protein n=1 Tax=Acidimangrovimonas pyrenivorans TaxID=2030798 RepID=A0ABV7AI88_9RHOB